MIGKLRLLGKIIFYYLTNKIISQEDYAKEYDKVSQTYSMWIQRMGKHTDHIIKLYHLSQKDNLKILDFACGSGYITQKLLSQNQALNITGIDISKGMIRQCKSRTDDGASVNFFVDDGIQFLSKSQTKYDAIFCGWALPYFNYKKLFPLWYNHLKDGGIVGIISNSKGTLDGIQEIFLDVMAEHQNDIQKILDIKFNLPNGRLGLQKWFERYGFEILEIGEGEEIAKFDAPEKLYDWLTQTGVLAGTASIFKDNEKVRQSIIKQLEKRKFFDGKYISNHKFVYGIFRKQNRGD